MAEKIITKKDFLTADKASKEFNVARDIILELMNKLYRHNVEIPGDPHGGKIITKNGSTHNVLSRYTIHPLGRNEFKKRLDAELAKGKEK